MDEPGGSNRPSGTGRWSQLANRQQDPLLCYSSLGENAPKWDRLSIFLSAAHTALIVAVMTTVIALSVFGYVKGRFTGVPPVRSAAQTVLVGGLAAAAFIIARAIS
jgi:hypothetical protein